MTNEDPQYVRVKRNLAVRLEDTTDPVAASYVELTVAIVTLQEHVRTLERAQRDTAANLHALLALNGKQIDLLRKIAELLEDDAA
jgi:hypothetical protein